MLACCDSNVGCLLNCSLEHEASLQWNNLSPNPRTAPSRSAKACTWYNWFCPFNTSNPYFLLPVSGKRMKSFLRFRLSSHSLLIETGRHDRPPIPRPSRLCTHCPLSSVGDEHHFVFECPYFNHSGTGTAPFFLLEPFQCDPFLPKKIA